MAERKLYTAVVTRESMLSEPTQTKHIEFEVPEMPSFDFIAGQFISIVMPNAEGKNITRAYSIASPPRGNKTFDLCLNRVEGGFMSNLLCDLTVGQSVKFHGPHGHFVLRNPLRDCIFVATGTGVAPMRSMLQWLFADPQRHEGRNLWLVYGMRYATDIYYQEEFEQMQAEHPNFKYLVTLSRAGEEWKGLRGYVQEHVRPIASGRTDADAYICGLADMVIANRDMLTAEGWEKKSVIFERYD